MKNEITKNPLRNSWLDVDLRTITNNIHAYSKLLKSETKLLVVLKANAYGHGAAKIARTVMQAGATCLGVATIGEAVELRKTGIGDEIVIIGLIAEGDIPLAIQNQCIITVSDCVTIQKIENCAKSMNQKVKVHMKVNTGMNRIGFCHMDEWKKAIGGMLNSPHIQWDGVFTHLADADGETKEYTKKQIQRLEALLDCIPEEQRKQITIHADNSAAIMAYPEYQYDMVRLGLGMYGYPLKALEGVQPALQWRSSVIYIHDVLQGDCIGYSCTAIAEKSMKVAVIPVGYADGYSRQLSNCGEVIIRGIKCNIVGRVCMDQIMVDVTDRDDITVGDVVTLLGKDGLQSISAADIAAKAKTITHEVLATLSARLPRYYQS